MFELLMLTGFLAAGTSHFFCEVFVGNYSRCRSDLCGRSPETTGRGQFNRRRRQRAGGPWPSRSANADAVIGRPK